MWQARSSPWRLSGLLLLSLIFVALGASMMMAGDIVLGVVGLVGILLFGASTVSIARRLSRGRAVAIEVTDSGICWRAWSDDLIAWDDIDHVEVRRQGRHHHLCLWLHRPTHFRSALATHGARLSKDMGFGDVAINTVGTDRRFDELVEAVRRHVTPD